MAAKQLTLQNFPHLTKQWQQSNSQSKNKVTETKYLDTAVAGAARNEDGIGQGNAEAFAGKLKPFRSCSVRSFSRSSSPLSMTVSHLCEI
ncbi:hypothetical protein D8674_034723 [Pyrus ussuriensis x Pyrus communis]|uniref:Uncharacterized protein n=1 Tax=Pyrus ussuriensis x Pyrus communis TaxID=2448454 RepID=A0A5N5GB80_9ROSA|nr:hypothetical protein D8674_034723 [Pyrus ussuriensis x Pyrus communis]